MASIIQKLNEKHLINVPKWLPDNTAYECIMGSVAYGVSSDTSDMDIYGYCLPPKYLVFPHLNGNIPGFGPEPQKFEQYSEHHIIDKETSKEYDLAIYSIVKFFNLAIQNNPNMVDALFVPTRCVLHITSSAQIVRDNRTLFLHKGCYHKFRGYAYAQLSKLNKGSNKSNPTRQKSIDMYGYDVKFGYHIVRLLLQVEQILQEHDLDLEANTEILKSIRRGEWTLEKITEWFDQHEKIADDLYNKSTLGYSPDYEAVKTLLLNVMENHYGSLDEAVKIDKNIDVLINELENVLNGYK